MAAAIARQYPFSDRLIVFLLPCFFLAIGGSLEWLSRARASRLLVGAASLVAIVPAIWPSLRTLPPYHTEPIKAVMLQMAPIRHAEDPVYVYYGGKLTADRAALPAEAFLYDQSDASRLALADSATFDVGASEGRGSRGEPLTCREGPTAAETANMAGRLKAR